MTLNRGQREIAVRYKKGRLCVDAPDDLVCEGTFVTQRDAIEDHTEGLKSRLAELRVPADRIGSAYDAGGIQPAAEHRAEGLGAAHPASNRIEEQLAKLLRILVIATVT